jgi:WD40-like Beta Propeller Repeat
LLSRQKSGDRKARERTAKHARPADGELCCRFATLAAIGMKRTVFIYLAFALLAKTASTVFAQTAPLVDLATSQEKHLRNVHQLTFGGQNAEAYFSAEGKKLIFQSSHGDVKCDQIFIMNIDGSDQHMVSTGKGRTTCSYFYPDGKKILYSSTHLASPECPPRPDFSKGYVWAVYSGYDIFTANPDGSNLKRLTTTPGYDAEATISLDGKKITSPPCVTAISAFIRWTPTART